jgi:hypothetical protein
LAKKSFAHVSPVPGRKNKRSYQNFGWALIQTPTTDTSQRQKCGKATVGYNPNSLVTFEMSKESLK